MEESQYKLFHLLETIIFLKNTSLFSVMKTGELRAVARIAEELRFDAGDLIVKENDVGDSLYLIKDGTVKISKSGGDDIQVTLAELSPGSCFGEMSVFDAEVRSASVKASTPCVLFRITNDDIIDVMLENPSIGIELIKVFINRLREANRKIESLTRKINSGENK